MITFAVIAGIFMAIVLPVAGLMLICRPLGHQFEWEKKLYGDNRIPKKKY